MFWSGTPWICKRMRNKNRHEQAVRTQLQLRGAWAPPVHHLWPVLFPKEYWVLGSFPQEGTLLSFHLLQYHHHIMCIEQGTDHHRYHLHVMCPLRQPKRESVPSFSLAPCYVIKFILFIYFYNHGCGQSPWTLG